MNSEVAEHLDSPYVLAAVHRGGGIFIGHKAVRSDACQCAVLIPAEPGEHQIPGQLRIVDRLIMSIIRSLQFSIFVSAEKYAKQLAAMDRPVQ